MKANIGIRTLDELMKMDLFRTKTNIKKCQYMNFHLLALLRSLFEKGIKSIIISKK